MNLLYELEIPARCELCPRRCGADRTQGPGRCGAGSRLKVARAEKGLSQTQLAELVGVSRNTISSIETGQFNPTAKLALILCIALDKKFEELFYFE